MKFSNSFWQRVKTLTRYYILTSFHNKSRLFLIVFWPIIDLLIWGFTTRYLVQSEAQPSLFLSSILATFILWNLTIKAQQEISCQFMADIYSRNLNNLLITPLKDIEILTALVISSLSKLLIVFSSLLFFAFVFYPINDIFQLNFWILSSFANLLFFGWSLGIFATALVARFGYRVDFITWTLAFMVQPISCVFYPRAILPYFLRVFSWLSPISYIFEGMREIIFEGDSKISNLYLPFFLNLLYLFCAYAFFIIMLKWARKRGDLMRI